MSKSESSDNVYKKLQRCRAELKKLPIKPTGNNKFAGYTYMELGDFLPHIVDLCDEYGLCPAVCFEEARATLTIYNIHTPEDKIIFTSPMSTAALKGCHEVQNLGAVETYIKRYLFTHAFDIVEHDALDSTHGKQEATKAGTGDSSEGKTPAAVKDGEPIIIQVKEITENSGSKNGKPWKSWTIISTEGEKFGTFSGTFAKEAARAEIHHLLVELTHKPATKYGKEIISLSVPGVPAEDDIPL